MKCSTPYSTQNFTRITPVAKMLSGKAQGRQKQFKETFEQNKTERRGQNTSQEMFHPALSVSQIISVCHYKQLFSSPFKFGFTLEDFDATAIGIPSAQDLPVLEGQLLVLKSLRKIQPIGV